MTTPRPGEDTALSLGGDTPAEAYCSTCGRSYTPDFDHCPEDGARLVHFAAQRDPLIGRTLDGRFEVRQPLGKGGMGTVYRALQLSVDREVAIKVVHPRLANDRQAAKRFLREARLASRLNQPNVVHVIDFGQTEDGVLYLVMELLRGRTLASELGGERRFTVKRALTIGLQLCDALEAAHAQGIVHRDLKPGNVVVLDDPPGRDLIKVLDFGLAKSLVADTSQVTNTDAILGTPLYMCPEQVQGKPSDQRGDLYSLGCILFELLTGAPPFTDESVNLILAKHLGDPPPPLPAHVPPRLRVLIEQLLAKDPDTRVQTAAEARGVIQWVQDSGVLAGGDVAGGAGAGSDTVPDVDMEYAATADVDRPTAIAARSGGGAARGAALAGESALVDGDRRSPARRIVAVIAVALLSAAAVVVFALSRSRERAGAPAPLDAAVPHAIDPAGAPGLAIDAAPALAVDAAEGPALDAGAPVVAEPPLDASLARDARPSGDPVRVVRPRTDAGAATGTGSGSGSGSGSSSTRPVVRDAGTSAAPHRAIDAGLDFVPYRP